MAVTKTLKIQAWLGRAGEIEIYRERIVPAV